MFTPAQIDAATDAALTALAWTTPTHPEDGDDYRGYLLDSGAEYSDTARDTMRDMLAGFMSDDRASRLFDLLALYGVPFTPEQIGHDFILTANRHGAGFWDRSYAPRPKAALEALSDLVRPYGSIDAYVSDAGQIEIDA